MPPPASTIEAISLQELHELWPQDESGRLCARLLQRYCYTLLIDSALSGECTAERAQAESGAARAVAKMTKDFATLAQPAPEKKPRTPMPRLHRFDQPENPDPEKK